MQPDHDVHADRSPFFILSGLVSIGLSAAFLVLLESRRSTTLELLRAGGFLYLLVPTLQALLGRPASGPFKKRLVYFLRRVFSFTHLAILTTGLLVAITCLEGIGYRHKQVVMLVKAVFYALVLGLQLARGDRSLIALVVLLAQLLLPFNSAFFTWNSYIQPLILVAYLLFVYELHRRERNPRVTKLHWFDLALALYVGYYLLLYPTVVNYQDSFLRLCHFALLMGLYVTVRRFYHPPRERRVLLKAIVWPGSIYTVATVLFQLLFLLDLPYGWPIDKTRKGQLITTQIAQHFMVMAPLALLTIRRRDGWPAKGAALLLSILSLVALLFTLARGSIGGLGISVLLCFVGAILLRHRRLLKYGLAFGALIAVGTAGLFYFSDNPELTGLFTLQQRMGLWYQAFHLGLQNWLTGTGVFISFNLFSIQTGDPAYASLVHEVVTRTAPWIAPHNLVLALLLSGGVGILAIFFAIIFGALTVLARTLPRAGLTRGVQAFLFAVLFMSLPIVGLTESLVSTPIPNFLIWILWALFAVFFRRELSLVGPRIPLAWSPARLPARLRSGARLALLALCLVVSAGNFLLYKSGVPISALQDRIKGLLVLNPDRSTAPEVHAELLHAESDLKLARRLLPFDWRPPHLLGEIALISAVREPERITEHTRRAAELYRAAIARNPRYSLLWLRLTEIYAFHDERTGRDTFAAERAAAERRTAELDPHFSYRRFWANPEERIDQD